MCVGKDGRHTTGKLALCRRKGLSCGRTQEERENGWRSRKILGWRGEKAKVFMYALPSWWCESHLLGSGPSRDEKDLEQTGPGTATVIPCHPEGPRIMLE